MSAKPNVALARWADTGGADKTAPSSGARNVGFQEGDPADQSIVNELIYQLYLSALYLSDGALSGGHSIEGDLAIGGQVIAVASTTFTADNTTDRFSATGLDLHTGDGPLRVSNSGGGLPAGLLVLTDYWAVRIDANTFQLAVSFYDALRGIVVDITTNGTGTHSIVGNTPTRARDLTVSRNLTLRGAQQLDNDLSVGSTSLTLASTTFTADSTTDELTVTNHGLRSGDGPIRVSNSGGALPSGLVAATDYWSIRTSSSKFQLASTFANAMAGIPIDITTNGTGTNSAVSSSAIRAGSIVVHGDVTIDGQLTCGITRGPLVLFPAITPFAIVGPAVANDYNPTGLSTARVIRFRTNGNSFISGIAAQEDNRVIELFVWSTTADADTITLKHDDAGSAAANRFFLPGVANMVIHQYGMVTLIYNLSLLRWTVKSTNF